MDGPTLATTPILARRRAATALGTRGPTPTVVTTARRLAAAHSPALATTPILAQRGAATLRGRRRARLAAVRATEGRVAAAGRPALTTRAVLTDGATAALRQVGRLPAAAVVLAARRVGAADGPGAACGSIFAGSRTALADGLLLREVRRVPTSGDPREQVLITAMIPRSLTMSSRITICTFWENKSSDLAPGPSCTTQTCAKHRPRHTQTSKPL